MSARAFVLFILLAAVFLYAAWSREQGTVSASFPTVVEPLGEGERRPVVVELFTSEGCSSCPPADALLIQLQNEQPVDGAEIIALGFHVDYWNRLGWVDRYSSPDFSRRQYQYAETFKANGVYTPQMIVDGHTEFVGSNESRARSAIRIATQAPKVPLRFSVLPTGKHRIRLSIQLQPFYPLNASDTPEVWVAVTESRISTEPSNGENSGRRLDHTGVVRAYRMLGPVNPGAEWTRNIELDVPSDWRAENCRAVAVVQERRSRVVLGAAQSPLSLEP